MSDWSYKYSGVIHRDKRHTYREEDERQAPHAKKRKKIHKKSNHKHEYIPCIFIQDKWGKSCGKICKTCGRIQDIRLSYLLGHENEMVANFKLEHPDCIEVVLPEGFNWILDKYVPLAEK